MRIQYVGGCIFCSANLPRSQAPVSPRTALARALGPLGFVDEGALFRRGSTIGTLFRRRAKLWETVAGVCEKDYHVEVHMVVSAYGQLCIRRELRVLAREFRGIVRAMRQRAP